MTTREFLSALAPHPDAPLRFETDHGVVAPGYHVTEFKAVGVDAVDCGGVTTAWRETILQVVPPARPEAAWMTVGKFLSIYGRAAEAVAFDGDALLRVETAAPGTVAIAYPVHAVAADAHGVTVALVPPAVACKGADRSVGDVPVLGGGRGGRDVVTACCGDGRVAGNACCA
jgi:hypothetical protein